MENEAKNNILKLDKNIFKVFFKEFIEDTRHSTEKKNTSNTIIITFNQRRNRTKNIKK